MPPLAGAIIGGVSGIAKGIGGAQREAKERQLAADTQRYSPWTGLQAGNISKANVAGDILGGAAGGAAASQSFNQMMPGQQPPQVAGTDEMQNQIAGLPSLQRPKLLG